MFPGAIWRLANVYGLGISMQGATRRIGVWYCQLEAISESGSPGHHYATETLPMSQDAGDVAPTGIEWLPGVECSLWCCVGDPAFQGIARGLGSTDAWLPLYARSSSPCDIFNGSAQETNHVMILHTRDTSYWTAVRQESLQTLV